MIEYAYILFQCVLAVIGGVLFLAVPALLITEGIMQYSKYKDKRYAKKYGQTLDYNREQHIKATRRAEQYAKKQPDISCPFE